VLQTCEDAFQRLADRLNLCQVDRPGGPFQTVRFAEDGFQEFRHQLLELLLQLVQVLRRRLGLLRAGRVLRAGLLDVLHRQRHLIHPHQLLLR